jgi:hypothetical protein
MAQLHKVKTKVKLMNRINQTVIFDNGTYMETDIISVYEDNKGKQVGKIKATRYPVIFDKESKVWREAA